jgi:YD repeat-containing protein
MLAPALAAPPEVDGLRFEDPGRLAWIALPEAVGYHVYQGDIGSLPGSFGECRLGSVSTNQALVEDEPTPGAGLTFLVAGFDESGEGPLGESSVGDPRAADVSCVPARRLYPIVSNGSAPDGVDDGFLARRNARTVVAGWDPADKHTRAAVVAATGELIASATDLELSGRGLDWTFERTYRSQVDANGPLGRGWFFSDGEHLRQGESGDIVHCDGSGRCRTFTRDGLGYASPDGQFAVLHDRADGSLALRYPDGLILKFDGFRGTPTDGALLSVEDRHGNVQRYLYDDQGLLTDVVDTLGRSISYEYDPSGRITRLSDFTGRELAFAYDADDHLTSVRSPAVTGTPTGNDFPEGKTTSYSYSTGFDDGRLNHNLLTITDARGQTWLTNTYSNEPDDPDISLTFDRVVRQDVGGTNDSGVSAGGTVSFSYEPLNSGAEPWNPDLKRRRAIITDPNGNVSEHDMNANGHELTEVLRTRGLRADDPESFRTERRFDADGLLQQVDFAGGGSVIYTYDDAGEDRYRAGNLLEARHVADPARGDGHGGDQPDLVTTYVYEPLYNQLRSRTEPRGNEPSYVPQNGGEWSAERYTTTWSYDYQEGDPDLNGVNDYAAEWGIGLSAAELGLGDLNGDGRMDLALGVPVRRTAPSVRLDSSGHQAGVEGDDLQEIVTTWTHNGFGQVVSATDPTGVTTTYGYHPETDPDGDETPTSGPLDGRELDSSTGGYRASTTDAAGGRAEYLYDPRGNLTDFVDPRGVRHVFVHNALDQVVEERAAAATSDGAGPSGDPVTGYGESGLAPLGYRTLYLYDENDNLVEMREEDRDDSRGLGGWLETVYAYDVLDRVVSTSREPRTGTTLTNERRYDANGNTTRVTAPGGNETQARYDERDRLLELTRGAAGPFGGTPATTSYTYDSNGNLTRIVDPAGEEITFEYDGVERLVRRIDRIGGVNELVYDPASNVVQTVARGTVGGPSPTDRTGSGNVVLFDARFAFDEVNRPTRRDLLLGMPKGASTARPAVLEEGSLDPADGLISRVTEYDAAGRPTFVTSDHGATQALTYETRGWLAEIEQPDGSSRVRTYDAAGALIEEEVIDLDSGTARSESYLTTHFYDALGRRTMSVDNIGRAHRFIWDSLSDLVKHTDPNGPPGGTIARRSPAHSGEEVPINDDGNLAEFSYDGLSRLTSTRRVLTASGAGDGTTDPPPDTSNPYNPSGEIRRKYVYDDSSRLTRAEGARGHAVTYAYDNLDRRTQATYPDDTTTTYSYDAAGNVVRHVDPAGSTFDIGYDAAHRPIRMDIVPAPGLEGTTLQTFEYDGRHRVTRATDNNVPSNPEDDSEVSLHYDLLGRLVEEQQRLPGVAASQPVDFGYLADDLVSQLILPSGRQIDYAYDPQGRLIQAADGKSSGGRVDFEHVGMSRVVRRQAGDGLETSIRFDGLARVAEVRDEHVGVLLSGWEYSYDPGGRLQNRLRLHAASGDLTPGVQVEWDSAGRIVSTVEGQFTPDLALSEPAEDEISSLLDAAGNESEVTWNTTTYAATPNNLDRYDEDQCCGTASDDGLLDDFLDPVATPDADGRNFAHDAAGNQTNTDARKIVYDAFGRPVEVLRDGGATTAARYAYDALNRQVRRDVTPEVGSEDRRAYHHAGHRVIEERDLGGDVLRQVAVAPSGALLWQLRDLSKPTPPAEHLLTSATGSIVALVTSGGSLLERMTYGTRGVPEFRDAGGKVKVDSTTGAPIGESDFGVRELLHGLPYLPELGERSPDANADWGGGYLEGATVFDPNQGKTLSSPGFAARLGAGDENPSLRANNHNTTRSNRISPSTYHGGGGGGGGGAVLRANNHNTPGPSFPPIPLTGDGGAEDPAFSAPTTTTPPGPTAISPSTYDGGRGGGGGSTGVLRLSGPGNPLFEGNQSTKTNPFFEKSRSGPENPLYDGHAQVGTNPLFEESRSGPENPLYDGHGQVGTNPLFQGRSSGPPLVLGHQGRLIDAEVSDSGLSQSDPKRALHSFINTTTGALKTGDGGVTLVGFGAFSISKRAARKGRNPQTGKEIKIPAKNVVRFKAGADLSSSVSIAGPPMGGPSVPLLPISKFGPR